MLSLGFVKSGTFENNTLSQRANFGYYTGTYGYPTGNRNFLFFSSSILNTTNGAGRHFGFVVRCEIPSLNLLSESYGLAEGYGTNRDTAVLGSLFRYTRNGVYDWQNGGLHGRDTHGAVYEPGSSGTSVYRFEFYNTYLMSGTNTRAYGYSVRCVNSFSNQFSPEAMGCPRDLV